jgi:CheY-like chemotaxis protein
VEALRIFGYINEIEYSELNTELTILDHEMIRMDGAETIELARHNMTPLNMYDSGEEDPADIPGMIPKEY